MSIAVFHNGYGGDFAQLWYSEYDGGGTQGSWTQDTPIEPPGGLDSWLSPSAVNWLGGITVFHQGWNSDVDADGQIWYTYSADGINWVQDKLITFTSGTPGVGGIVNYGSVSPVVYNGNLYIFYQGGPPTQAGEGPPGIDLPPPSVRRPPPGARIRQNDTLYSQLLYSRYDGSNWYGPYTISNVGITGTLGSAVVWMGGITVFYQGVRDDDITQPDGSLWYAYSPDGVNWGDATPVAIAGLSQSPSALVYGDHLCVFYQGYGNNGQLFYSIFDGTNWQFDNLVTTLALSGSPSVVEWDSGIAVFHQGGGADGTLRWVYSTDGSPGNWSGDMLVNNVGVSNSPSALVIPPHLSINMRARKLAKKGEPAAAH